MMKKLKKQATLCLILNNDQVLLAMKKRGFGVGKWNGAGGKPEKNESIEEAAIRETKEEIGMTPLNIKKVGIINFIFDGKKADWSQQVTVFTTNEWEGEPIESEEMRPKWFSFNEIPYKLMWDDDVYWMPEVLAGKLIKAEFIYSEDEKIVSYKITHSKDL